MKTKLIKETINKIYKYRNHIDLEPEFQREKVWPPKKQQYFIDTILKGWGIPKFYFHVLNEGGVNKEYSCIDGKQRLIAIFSFLKNDLILRKEYNRALGGKTYKELYYKKQNQFDDFKLHIEEVSTDDDNEISELFRRLQCGYPLNSGENLMAVNGDLRNKIKGFVKHNFFKSKTTLPNKRYAHFTVCVQLTFIEINGITNLSFDRLKEFIERYRDLKSAGFEIKTKLVKVQKVLDLLDAIFTTRSEYIKNRATIVSFYILISELMDKGNIQGKETLLRLFFEKFMKDLHKEIDKGAKAKNAQLINYQSAVTQGADKQKSIKLRKEILLEHLFKYDPVFYSIFNPHKDPLLRFNDLYDEFERKFGNATAVDVWIFKQSPRLKKITCGRSNKIESMPTHIRHCIHHKSHGTYTSSQFKGSIKILEKLKDKLPG